VVKSGKRKLMNARVEIRDAISNELLQTMADITYDNEGRAFQNCGRWYSQELESWANKDYSPQIILVPIVTAAAAALGKKGGSATTEAKQQASRENGRKGGRPRKDK
jgi:hypothetical protein